MRRLIFAAGSTVIAGVMLVLNATAASGGWCC
jgi:hypothetical protein